MKTVLTFTIWVVKTEFFIAALLIELLLRFWQTLLLAAIVGGLMFAAVYFYNYYTLELVSKGLIYTLIAIWLVMVFWSFDREKDKDLSRVIPKLKAAFEEIVKQFEDNISKDL